MHHKLICHPVLLFETILSHLFSIDYFIRNVFLYIFDMFRDVKQPDYIWIRSIWHDKSCRYYILRPWDNLRCNLIIHHNIILKHNTIAALCNNHRLNLLIIFYLFICNVKFRYVLLIRNVVHCFYNSLLIINHSVDIVCKCDCWVHVYLQVWPFILFISSFILCF